MRWTLLTACLVACALPAGAQEKGQEGGQPRSDPQAPANRFVFSENDDGIFRFDTQTGEVSLCSRQGSGWACRLVPDERGTLENEVVRLQNENAELKRALTARAAPKAASPPSAATAPQTEKSWKRNEPVVNGPTSDDFKRVATIVTQIWRRLVDMMATLQSDLRQRAKT